MLQNEDFSQVQRQKILDTSLVQIKKNFLSIFIEQQLGNKNKKWKKNQVKSFVVETVMGAKI